jgi:hypothetical protein
VLLNTVDAVMWTISRGERLGLGTEAVADRYAWLFFLTGVCLGYVELLLTAGLARDTIQELNGGRETQGVGVVQTLSLVGLIVWSMLALTQTDWSCWPPATWFGPEFPMLWLFTTAIVSILCFLVTALCLTAARQLRQTRRLAETSEAGIDLLRSRSETEGDEIRWRD